MGNLQLAGCDSTQNNLFEVRPLTKEEIDFDANSRPVFIEARSRFDLFQIIELNYSEWKKYHRELLTSGHRKQNNMLGLNRLLFNFLASAYGVIQHFEVSYSSRHKKDAEKMKEYKGFMNKFYENCWSAAFFMDLRNYTQHVGLPIGSFNRKEDTNSIRISITHDSSKLLHEYHDWKRSKLSLEHGELDLIKLSEEFNYQLRRNYGGFMARHFYPKLECIDQFYWKLTQEVRMQNPKARMVFLTKKNKTATTIDFAFEQPPNAVFEELGIITERENQ